MVYKRRYKSSDNYGTQQIQAKSSFLQSRPFELPNQDARTVNLEIDDSNKETEPEPKASKGLEYNLLENISISSPTPPAEPNQLALQMKGLTIGKAGDKYEQEADCVAQKIVSEINASPLELQQPASSNQKFTIQKKKSVEASEKLKQDINSAKGAGLPLENSIRSKMEWGFGANFSQVKVHTDDRADRLNQSIQAKAFTTGQDIFFKQGEFQPESQQGQELLAHELTHVVQQNSPQVQPKYQIVHQISDREQINCFFDDIWDKITETVANSWNALTNQPSNTGNSDEEENNKTSDSSQINVPVGEFTVTDSQAIIRRPPPNLTPESGKPLIAEGSQVEILEGFRKGNKYYVKVQEKMPSGFEGPMENSGWTAASNIEGLPQTLLTLNPTTNDPEIVVPKPSNKGTFGLPEKPEIENPEFASIVQEIEEMEQNPLAVESKHGEETGDERSDRVEKIGELRQRIAALAEKIPELEASQIQATQAYLYRRLAPLAPYYGQMANTNILEKGSKGWSRTCNVTVPAMVIEGVGKTKADYDKSKIPLLKKIFNALEGKYKKRKKYDAANDFDALRLPDFLALVGIARWMPENLDTLSDEQFIKKVSEARSKAAKKTTTHNTMMYLIDQFGCSHKKYNVKSSELDEIGTAQKDYTKAILRGKNPEAWRELYDLVESGEKSFDELNQQEKKRYQTIWKYEQFNKEKADASLSVEDYRKLVLKKVNPLLDRGTQILVGMENHFVRLDMLDTDKIQVDDPGEKGFKNLQVSWEQARNLGYFKGFWAIES